MKQLDKFAGAFLCALLAACGGNGALSSAVPAGVAGWNHAPVTFSFELAAHKSKPEFVLDAGVSGAMYVYQVTGAGKTLIGVVPSEVPGFTQPSSVMLRTKHARPLDITLPWPPITVNCRLTSSGITWTIIIGSISKAGPTGALNVYASGVENGKFQTKYIGALEQSAKNGGLGLAFDSSGNLYASNSGSNAIDVFTAAEVKSGSGKPVRTLHTKLLTQVYWLTTAGKTLLANGLDKSGNYDVTNVSVKTGADKLVNQLCQPNSSSACYPGGMEVGPKPSTVLYVNNETNNTIGAYARPWTGAPTSTITYPSTDLVASIALDTTNKLLWGGNQDEADGFTCGTDSQFYDAADNLGFTLPLKSIQTNTPPYGSCVSGVLEWDAFAGTTTTSMFKT
jgi:hypothetical protein